MFIANIVYIFFYTFCYPFRYTGTEDSSNMVIVDMKLLSGFKLEPSSLDAVRQLKSASNKFPQMFTNIFVCTKKFFPQLKKSVHRVESKDDHVIMYLQEVGMITCMVYNDNQCD